MGKNIILYIFMAVYYVMKGGLTSLIIKSHQGANPGLLALLVPHKSHHIDLYSIE